MQHFFIPTRVDAESHKHAALKNNNPGNSQQSYSTKRNTALTTLPITHILIYFTKPTN